MSKLDSDRFTDRELLIYLKLEVDGLREDLTLLRDNVNSGSSRTRVLEDFKLEMKTRQEILASEQRIRNKNFMIYFSIGSALCNAAFYLYEHFWGSK